MVILVPMMEELIMPNVNVPIIMNGVPRKRSVFVPLLSNILVRVQAIQVEREILAIANIRNASVPMVLHGMLRKEHVFVPALISAR